MSKNSIMIFGLGDLGGYVLEFLTRMPHMPKEEAIKINNEAQVFDGVELIEDDGTIVLTDKAAAIFKKLLDFDCKSYTVKDCEAKARELLEKFKKWAAKF